eukprot:scaffold103831_cov62-Cyclotella_meneghiniana.AAC.1
MHVCKRLADETGGLAGVCLDGSGRHLRVLIMAHAIPPPVNAARAHDVTTTTTTTTQRFQ